MLEAAAYSHTDDRTARQGAKGRMPGAWKDPPQSRNGSPMLVIDDDAIEAALRTAAEVLTEMNSQPSPSGARPYVTQASRLPSRQHPGAANLSTLRISPSPSRRRTNFGLVLLLVFLIAAALAFGGGFLFHEQITWLLHAVERTYSTGLNKLQFLTQ